jgi:hypothetical protein
MNHLHDAVVLLVQKCFWLCENGLSSLSHLSFLLFCKINSDHSVYAPPHLLFLQDLTPIILFKLHICCSCKINSEHSVEATSHLWLLQEL